MPGGLGMAWFSTRHRVSRQPSFRAKTTAWALDGLTFSRVVTPPISVSRSKMLIRRNPVDHWGISLGKQQATELKFGNDVVKAPAGVPFVFSLGEEVANDRAGERI